ncbi:hypothetical protein M9X92_003519 [Pyricularia oryzae]|nr:hypothetical protein M9X92_003519 [Pyricularia oryzae]
MYAQSFVAFLALANTALGFPHAARSTGSKAELFAQLEALTKTASEKTLEDIRSGDSSRTSASCTPETVKVRKEWGALSRDEKLAYIDAVKCLQSKPGKTPADLAEGVRTRFDDFVATHINQTMTIHYTGNFLSWHRYYTHLYEETLREECGYNGAHPYWDWALTAETGMETSPIWDGSETSLDGNGEFIADKGPVVIDMPGLPPFPLPTGSGGGCVTSGPFANLTVNLGPISLPAPGPVTLGPPGGKMLGYNPRCLKRDLTSELIQQYANINEVLDLITKPTNIDDFQMTMQGVPGVGLGVHGSGHMSMGGDPGMDVYASPGDPVFYLHHGMIDKAWWIWQKLGGEERVTGEQAIFGTKTMLNMPASDQASLEDFVEYGFAAGPPRQIKELMSTTMGPFCYVYE